MPARDRTRAGPPTGHLPAPAAAGVRLRRRRGGRCPTCATSASRTSTSPRSCRPRPARRTATTSSTTRRLNEDLGGAAAFHRLSDARRRRSGWASSSTSCPTTWRCRRPASLNAALWSVLRDGPASPYARWFDVDWAAQERGHPDAGAGAADRRGAWPTARSPSTATPRSASRCCATSTTCSRCGPAPRTCRCRSCWTGSSTGWRTGGSATRSSTTGGSSTSTPWPASGSRTTQVFAETHAVLLALVRRGPDRRAADRPPGRAGRPARLPPAAGRARPAARGSSSRRSSRATSSCPPTGRAPARPGYDALLRVGGVLVDPGGGAPLDRPLHRPHRRAGRLRRRSSRRPSGSSSSTACSAEVARLVEVAAAICHDAPRAARPHPARAARGAGRAAGRGRRSTARTSCPASRRPAGAREHRRAAAAVARGAAGRGPARHARPASCALALGDQGRGPHRRRVRRAVPADLRPGDGQGRRGHRVLPLAAADRAQRGRRRPRRTSASPVEELHAWCARQLRDLAGRDDHAVDPRHQAQRGRPGPARRARRAAAGVGRRGHRVARGHRRTLRPAGAGRATPSTCCGRRWSAPGRSTPARLTAYLEKATREAKRRTTWTEPDEEYDDAVRRLRRAVLADADVHRRRRGVRRPARAGLAGQRARRRSCWR